MSNANKTMVYVSMGLTAVVGLLAILDLAIKIPFAGQTVMDIMFLIAVGMVGYMCWDTYQDIK